MPIQCTCDTCGAIFPRGASKIHRKNYCSRRCKFAGQVQRQIRADLIVDGDVTRIPIYSRDGAVRGYAFIDTADTHLVGCHRWCLDTNGYAMRNTSVDGVNRSIDMHRIILGLSRGDLSEGDHINRDRLDNRRSNLRELPNAGNPNGQNQTSHQGSSSGHRGVSARKRGGGWEAYIRVNKKKIHLGVFFDEEQAAQTAREARLRLLPYAVD